MQNKDQGIKNIAPSKEIEKKKEEGGFDNVALKEAFEEVFTAEVVNDYLRKYTESERGERKEKLQTVLIELSSSLATKAQTGELLSTDKEAVLSTACEFLESKRYGRLVKIIRGEEVGLVDESFIESVEADSMDVGSEVTGKKEGQGGVTEKVDEDPLGIKSKSRLESKIKKDTPEERLEKDLDVVDLEEESTSAKDTKDSVDFENQNEVSEGETTGINLEEKEKSEEVGTKTPEATNREFFDTMKLDPDKVYVNKKDGKQLKVVGFSDNMVQVIFLPAGTKKDDEGVNVISLDSDWEDGIDEKQMELSAFLGMMREYDEAGEGELEIANEELEGDGTVSRADSLDFKDIKKGKGEVTSLDELTDLFGVAGSRYKTADGSGELEIVSYLYRKDETEWDIKIRETGVEKVRKISPDELQDLLVDKYTENSFVPEAEEKMKKEDYESFRADFGRAKEFVYENTKDGGPFMIAKHKYSKQRKQNQVKIQLMERPASFWISAKEVQSYVKKDEGGSYLRVSADEYELREKMKGKELEVVETGEIFEKGLKKFEGDVEDPDIIDAEWEEVNSKERASKETLGLRNDEEERFDKEVKRRAGEGKEKEEEKGVVPKVFEPEIVEDNAESSDEDIIDAEWKEVEKPIAMVEHKPESGEITPERASQDKMNEKFKIWKEAQVNYQQKANKLSIVKKGLAKLNIAFGDDFEAMKELKSSKKQMKDAEADFKAAHSEFSEISAKKRKDALDHGGYKGKKREELLKEYLYKNKAVENEIINEEGEKIVEMITLIEDLHNKMLELNKAREEALNERDKSIVSKLFDKYRKLPKKAKVAIGVGLVGTLGASTALAGGAAVGVAIGAGASSGAAKLIRSLAGGFASAETFKIATDKLSNSREERTDKMERGTMGKYLKGSDMDLVSMMQKKMNMERNDNIKAMTAAGITGVAVGGGFKIISDLDFIDSGAVDSNEPALSRRIMGKLGADYDPSNGNATFVGEDPTLRSSATETVSVDDSLQNSQENIPAADTVEDGGSTEGKQVEKINLSELGPEDKAFGRICTRFEKQGFQDTDAYRRFQTKFGPDAHIKFVEAQSDGTDAGNEQAEGMWDKKVRRGERAYMMRAGTEFQMNLADDLAEKMGIEFDPQDGNIFSEGKVPTEINGTKVPMDLLTEKQQRSVLFARQIRAGSGDYVLTKEDAEMIADINLAEAKKIMDSAALIAEKMELEFDPATTVVMQEAGIPTVIGGEEVPMDLLTEKQQKSIMFSRELGDLPEKVTLERVLPEYGGTIQDPQLSNGEGIQGGVENGAVNETVETANILSREELSAKLKELQINEKDGAWRALRGMTLKELQEFPKTEGAAVAAWKDRALNLSPEAKSTLGYVDIREAGRMGRMAGVALSELEDIDIEQPEKVTLENALRGDYTPTVKDAEVIEQENPVDETIQADGGDGVDNGTAVVEEVARGHVADAEEVSNTGEQVTQEALKGLDIKLKEHEKVWSKLAEHYEGDQAETAKTMVEFENGVTKELIAKGMTESKAKDFIDWRFRHLPVGQSVKLDDNGLNIDGFIDKKTIASFDTKYTENIADLDVDDSDVEGGIGSESLENLNSSVSLELVEAGVNDELMNAGIEVNSSTWNSIKGMSLAKLLEEVPPSDQEISKIWNSREEIVDIEELKQDGLLDGVSYEEFAELQKISNMMGAWSPSSSELSMQLGDYLTQHVTQTIESGEEGVSVAQVSEGVSADSVERLNSSDVSTGTEVTAENFLDSISDKERALFAETEGKKFLDSVQIAADNVKDTQIQAEQFYRENRIGIETADSIHSEVGFSKKNISTSIVAYLERGNSLTTEQLQGLARFIKNVDVVKTNSTV